MNLKAKPLTIYISAIISGFPMVGLASQNTDNVGAGETVFDVILDGGTQVVHGTVNNSIINAGRQDISASRDGNIGTANDTIINGGGQFVSGGMTNGTVVNSGGTQTVTGIVYPGVGSYQGVANNTTVNDGGRQSVSTIANGTKVNTGGKMNVGLNSGARGESGVSNNSTINGGLQVIFKTGTSNDDILLNGGIQDNGGVSNNTIVQKDGTQNVNTSGIANSTVLNGGVQNVMDGGIANGTIINSGTQNIDGGVSNDTVQQGGRIYITNGGISNNMNQTNGHTYVDSGGTINNAKINNGGFSYLNINDGGVSNNTIISGSNSMREIVNNGGIAYGTSVYDGGTQYLSKGGTAYGTTIHDEDSLQYVSSGATVDSSVLLDGIIRLYGYSKNAIMYGGIMEVAVEAIAEDTLIEGGIQEVEYGGVANNTAISGGIQKVSTGGIANNTTINRGSQQIHAEGEANNTNIKGGIQYVYTDGVANDTTITGGTQSVFGGTSNSTYVNGRDATVNVAMSGVANNVIVERGNVGVGMLSGSSGIINTVSLKGNNSSLLVMNGGTASNVLIDGGKQTVNGTDATTDTVRLMGGSQVLVYGGTASHTYIEGGKQIVKVNSKTINTTIISGQSLLETGALAEGTTSVHQNGELLMEAGARATDVSLDGGILSITDLNDSTSSLTPAQVDTLTMSGGTVSFLRDSEGEFAALNITELNGTGNFLFNSSLAERNSNFVTIEQGSGHFDIAVTDSGKEISDHTDLTVNLIHEQGGDINFEMVTASGRSTRAVDGGTYMYTLFSQQDKDGLNGGNVWYLGAMTDEPGGGENPGGGDNGNAGGNGNGSKKPMTTPATDAILAMSNAGLNVIHSELDGLRTYRATLDKTGPESNVWGHYLGSKNNIDTSNGAAYQLNQNGMEIGADTRTDFERGSLVTGAFMSYTDNKVKHDRGGKSKIDSYGLGLYATWFDASGFYVDGVVKGNRINNKLSAVMTNGGKTSGDWKQYALSTAVEGGYQFDFKDDVSITPYARLTFVQMTSEDVKLSNGMKGNTGTPRSVTGEAGAKLAGKFNLGSTEFKPYLSAAVVQEFANSNEVTINERNRFDNNVKGTSGKYGLGASVNVGKDVTLYGEANYRQGSQIETPIQGVAGIRIGF